MLNIPSTVIDPKFRYKMPKMQLKIQSKGNGIKTNIVNLGDVAKYLRTNEQYILKWFGFEKASQTTFKEAGGKNNTNYIINGEFTQQDLRKVLDKFIEKYVCCPKCKLPEMYLTVNGEKINGKCDSCPFVGQLDNKHRLASFIIKNPPVFKSQANKGKVEVEKMSANTTNQMDKKESKPEEPVEAEVAFNPNIMEFGSEQLQNFISYLKECIQKLKDEDFDIKSAKLVHKIKPLGLKKPLVAYAIFKSFFTVNINQQLKEHSKLYLNLVKKLITSQSQLETLLNLEYLFLETNKEKDYTKFLPTILYNVVKEGLLSEEFLLEWASQKIPDIDTNFLYNASRDALFKKAVQQYLDSLEEDEGEEEEEQEEKVEAKKEEETVEQKIEV